VARNELDGISFARLEEDDDDIARLFSVVIKRQASGDGRNVSMLAWCIFHLIARASGHQGFDAWGWREVERRAGAAGKCDSSKNSRFCSP
jgi:hypothetical protein